jgi:hypothetical protein
MQSRTYDVLLLRPQEIMDVIDIATAIDLVEQGYREAQSFHSSTLRAGVCTRATMYGYRASPAELTASA